MQAAMDRAGDVRGIVAADIAPVTYQPSHGAVFAAIQAVAAARPPSRSAAAEIMRQHIEEEGVVQFLLLSLHRDDERAYVWRFNAQGLYREYANLLQAPDEGEFAGPALFIYGGRSTYMSPAGLEAARQRFPGARFAVIEETGHWLHAEKADEFNAAVLEFVRGVMRGGSMGETPGEAHRGAGGPAS